MSGVQIDLKREGVMADIYVDKDQLQEVSEVLTGEGVNFQVTDKTFYLIVEGKVVAEVVEVKAQLLETEMPAILEDAPDVTLRAFRLPSGGKFLLTDIRGNFVRLVTPPPGWER
jgi:hypothetical protein